jgi:acyl-CoA synthetase (NDP forming)/GNAT superfamily N-acetyltransferase
VDADDSAALEAFLTSLSPQSRLLRFFSGGIDVTRAAAQAAHPETSGGYGIVATTGPDDHIIAHGCYELENGRSDAAEVALTVADEHQQRGLGTLMLGHLAEVADDHDITLFTAHVLPENHRMLRVLRDSGFPVTQRIVPGDIEITLPTALTPPAREQFERREQLAAVAALGHVLSPRSVAVIGASRHRGTPGGEVFHNLITGGFAGPVYPVHDHAHVVQSVAAYRSISDVPEPVELAIVAVPADAVVTVAEQCAAADVRAIVVLSGGFAETGAEGATRQDALVRVCRQAGMRLVGPNCVGVVNTDPSVRLNGQFGPWAPATGRVGLLSQSGALGLAVIDYADMVGSGLSSFVSAGNKADLSSNDLLQYWETDPHTDVILLYIESFGNPRKFSRIARRVARTKPIVAVKSGRTPAGATAASSHTGTLLHASDRTVDALFRQAGVVRTDTLSELFDVATLLTDQPAPTGRRVGIVTNAGGPGILCADACVAEGLDVVGLSEETQRALHRVLGPDAATGNPVDAGTEASPDDYRRAISLIGDVGAVDAIIAIHVPMFATDPRALRWALQEAAVDLDGRVPLLSVIMTAPAPTDPPLEGRPRVPTYPFPEDAVRALAQAAAYGAWRATPPEPAPEPVGVDHDRATAVLADVIGDAHEGRWLTSAETAHLFACYGIGLPPTHEVGTVDEAVAAAQTIDAPVALKASAPGLVHKIDVGAVQLDLRTAEDVATAAEAIRGAVAEAGHTIGGYVVQPMVQADVELVVGVTHDPTFGPVIVCGAGGTVAELVRDIAVRITPLTARDASQMVRSLDTYPLLQGYRGAARANVAAVEDLLLRVSALADHQPAIAEIDCNPVMVDADRAVVIDARVLVRPHAQPAPRDR